MKSFAQPVIEALKCYVYCLVDPVDNHIFYVGKGSGNRVFQHVNDAIDGDAQTLKLQTIRNIIGRGENVKYYILRHGLTDAEAFLVESAIIDLLTYNKFNKENLLTNIVAGHHQWDEGIKTINEIENLYMCENISLEHGHRLLLVCLNQSYDQKKASGVYVRPNIYECARKYWCVNKQRADCADYVLGVYKGVVRVVIKPTSKWIPCDVADDGTCFEKTRYMVEGVTDDEIGNRLYLNKDVTEFPFSGGFRYIPSDIEAWK